MDFKKLEILLKQKSISLEILGFDVIDSTNIKAVEMLRKGLKKESLFVANKQSAGQGNRGRKWESNHTKGIWATLAFPSANRSFAFMESLAVAIAGVFTDSGVTQTFIKWPNDILCEGKKIAGLLAESVKDASGNEGIAIGFGVNINQNENDFSDEIKTIATSLYILTQKEQNLEIILANILSRFFYWINRKEDCLFKEYLGRCDSLARWCDLDGIRVYTKDITRDGGLVVLTEDGKEEIKYSGTLRYEI
jgi:BirA family biotin operon repressor/biotin-[acetyl-CoA-carboxylase] ligase